jgi:hypothetical protein
MPDPANWPLAPYVSGPVGFSPVRSARAATTSRGLCDSRSFPPHGVRQSRRHGEAITGEPATVGRTTDLSRASVERWLARGAVA